MQKFNVGDIIRYKNRVEEPGTSWIQDHFVITEIRADNTILGKVVKAVHRIEGMTNSWNRSSHNSLILVKAARPIYNFTRDSVVFRYGKI